MYEGTLGPKQGARVHALDRNGQESSAHARERHWQLNSVAVCWVCACHMLYSVLSKEVSIPTLGQPPEAIIKPPCDWKDFWIRKLRFWDHTARKQ